MPVVIFQATAAGPNFGPCNVGDRANLTSQTITNLNAGPFGTVVIQDPNPQAQPTTSGGTE